VFLFVGLVMMDDSVVEAEEGEVEGSDLSSLMERFSQDERVKRALADGVDLREYARRVESELGAAERDAVLVRTLRPRFFSRCVLTWGGWRQDYAGQAEEFAAVHGQIRDCDAILEQMERTLSGFQGHLGSISSEIRHLQEESTALSVKLANRQAVSSRVTDFVQSAVIPEAMAKDICDAPVSFFLSVWFCLACLAGERGVSRVSGGAQQADRICGFAKQRGEKTSAGDCGGGAGAAAAGAQGSGQSARVSAAANSGPQKAPNQFANDSAQCAQQI
jgi:hypothetical protein